MPDKYQAIRDALALGPTPGPYRVQRPNAGRRGYEVAACDGLEQICADLTVERAEFIAACDPETITALLAENSAEAMQAESKKRRE